MRASSQTHPIATVLSKAMLLLLAVQSSAFIVATCLMYHDLETYWIYEDVFVSSKGIEPVPTLEFTRSALHIITDLVMLLIPLPTVRRLQMPLKKKLQLAATFATGSV